MRLVHPLRDAFAAIFFFAFGLAIDPGDFAAVLAPVALAATLTLCMNVAAGLIVARLHGYGPEPAANIAATLLARGEFALILAAMAASAGLDDRLAPFIAGYVLVLAVLGPVAAGRAHLLVRLVTGGRTPTAPTRPTPADAAADAAADAEPGPPDEPAASATARRG